MRTSTLGEIAALLGGEIDGDRGTPIDRLEPPEEAGEGALAVLSDRKALASIASCRASAIVVPAGTQAPGRSLVRVPDPRRAFVALLAYFAPGPILEIGSYHGLSTSILARAVADSGPEGRDRRIVSVELDPAAQAVARGSSAQT